MAQNMRGKLVASSKEVHEKSVANIDHHSADDVKTAPLTQLTYQRGGVGRKLFLLNLPCLSM